MAADNTGPTAEDALAKAREVYGPPQLAKPKCPEAQTPGELVVCALPQDDSDFRVNPTSTTDPRSAQALDDGIPRAPDVAGDGIFKGPGTMSGGCFLNKCPPPPAYIVDFSKLPEPPPGSDADRMARGEIPGP
ncbi:hypothetical protein [Altericroceibacterium endophyticum]|uniref:Uncharacterized protein n=1 Tax=Altericroceibacterium endophyticum TaxID=1808508 RepID=A0A6I4T4I4_9SPHN|nr:hypothetical protein [Altericroceibacterium endophyticum]MXO65776.1 hypothetical protein [Altericroceibacterium endophyticum]